MRNQQSIEKALEMLKQETATEMGIELGANTSSRLNGAVGGRVTQKLIELGKQQLIEMSQEQGIKNVNYLQTNINQGNPPTYDHLH